MESWRAGTILHSVNVTDVDVDAQISCESGHSLSVKVTLFRATLFPLISQQRAPPLEAAEQRVKELSVICAEVQWSICMAPPFCEVVLISVKELASFIVRLEVAHRRREDVDWKVEKATFVRVNEPTVILSSSVDLSSSAVPVNDIVFRVIAHVAAPAAD